MLDTILAEKVDITEAGVSRRMTKEEVALRRLVNGAMAGDRHCMRLLVVYLERRQAAPQERPSSALDDFLIKELAEMLAHGDAS
jgi:hypothetical protein